MCDKVQRLIDESNAEINFFKSNIFIEFLIF